MEGNIEMASRLEMLEMSADLLSAEARAALKAGAAALRERAQGKPKESELLRLAVRLSTNSSYPCTPTDADRAAEILRKLDKVLVEWESSPLPSPCRCPSAAAVVLRDRLGLAP